MNKIKEFFSQTDFTEYWDEFVLFVKHLGFFAVGCLICYVMYLCAAGVFAALALAFGAFIYGDWQRERVTR